MLKQKWVQTWRQKWTSERRDSFMTITSWNVERWTPEQDTMIKAMAAQGCSGTVIAKKLKKSRSAILGRFYRLGINLGDHNGYNACRASSHVASKPKRAQILMFTQAAKKIKLERGYKPVPLGLKDEKPVAMIDPNHKCTIEELGDHQCRWPLWNDESKVKHYCGAPVRGKTYCTGHTLVATTERGYALYAKREPLRSLVTKTLPANSPKSTVA